MCAVVKQLFPALVALLNLEHVLVPIYVFIQWEKNNAKSLTLKFQRLYICGI